MTASTFWIDLSSGDVLETSGVEILMIDCEGYHEETKDRPL